MKIKLYSSYNHFANHVPEEGEDYIECFDDLFIKKVKVINPEKSIALVHEPRPIQPKVYEYIEEHYNDYKYVFCHDSKLLSTLPNAKLLLWTKIWNCDFHGEEKDFEHPISMVASWKEVSPIRIERKKLAYKMRGIIDTYGTFDGGAWVRPDDIYAKYPYSIVIENHIDDWWITEKICNCFACNTIPIYWGGSKAAEIFNPEGIIFVSGIEEIKDIVKYLLGHAKEEYECRKEAIADNRERVKQFNGFENWFFRTYGDLLDEMGDSK